jgi:hypothetical protein
MKLSSSTMVGSAMSPLRAPAPVCYLSPIGADPPQEPQCAFED